MLHFWYVRPTPLVVRSALEVFPLVVDELVQEAVPVAPVPKNGIAFS